MPSSRLAPLLLLLSAFIGSASALDLSRKPQGGTELLSADEAFRLVSADALADGVHLSWAIAPGYYLYRHRIAAEPVDGAPALAALVLPKGTPKQDEHFGAVEIFTTRLDARLPIAGGARRPAQIRLRWQGCADAGVCYPPVTRVVDVVAAP